MKAVWITGAQGFIGRHLSKHLGQLGVRVYGIGHGACPYEVAIRQGLQYWLNGDLEPSNFQLLLAHSGVPDAIFHLAGGSSVGISFQTPAEDFRRSVVSTSSLLEWVRVNAPECKIVVSSSAAVYGNSESKTLEERSPLCPFSPYGFHKRATEIICESYAKSFGMKFAIVRLFSVFGPGLRKQLLWDASCRLLPRPELLSMHGTGKEVRDWLHVVDAVKILVEAANRATNVPTIVNGGTGLGTNVHDVLLLLCQSMGLAPEIEFSGQKRDGDPNSLVADVTELKKWNIRLEGNLAQGLAEYAHWFTHLRQ